MRDDVSVGSTNGISLLRLLIITLVIHRRIHMSRSDYVVLCLWCCVLRSDVRSRLDELKPTFCEMNQCLAACCGVPAEHTAQGLDDYLGETCNYNALRSTWNARKNLGSRKRNDCCSSAGRAAESRGSPSSPEPMYAPLGSSPCLAAASLRSSGPIVRPAVPREPLGLESGSPGAAVSTLPPPTRWVRRFGPENGRSARMEAVEVFLESVYFRCCKGPSRPFW